MRIHYLDGMTLEETAVACGVSRATAARWLLRARQHILAETLRRMRETLRLSPAEVESIVRLVRSQLDVSIHRHLGADGPGPI